ncbi:MAG: hypothetical protein AAGF12_09770 [Myxococcota bacterium]
MAEVTRLVLVYNAEWNLRGGVEYAARLLKDRKDPCALCEITYDGLRENKAWQACRVSFAIPVEGVYKNQLEATMDAAAEGQHPCVLAEVDDGTSSRFVRVVEAARLEECRETEVPVECLFDALRDGLTAAGLPTVA